MSQRKSVNAEPSIPKQLLRVHPDLQGVFCIAHLIFRIENNKPGNVVLSEEANQKYPLLINVLSATLAYSNVTLDAAKRADAGNGENPHQDILSTLALVQDEGLAIAKRHGLELEEAATSAALATSFIVQQCAANIGAEKAFNAAVSGFIQGSKTVPPPLDDKSASHKPWYKIWAI